MAIYNSKKWMITMTNRHTRESITSFTNDYGRRIKELLTCVDTFNATSITNKPDRYDIFRGYGAEDIVFDAVKNPYYAKN